jgi:hypothetical protein
MIVHVARQPKIEHSLSDQISIALNLFDTILKTAITRVELERSWDATEQDISIQERLEARKRQLRNHP